MVKLTIWFMGLMSFPLLAVPLRLISPKEVNNTTGFTISTTGTYLLSDDVIFNYSGPIGTFAAIYITSSNVTLDLNGKSLTATTVVSAGVAIEAVQLQSAAGNVTIRNGTITSRNLAIEWAADSVGGLLENVTVNGGVNLGASFGVIVRNSVFRSSQTGVTAPGSGHKVSNCQFFDGSVCSISGNNIYLKDCTVERGKTVGFTISGKGCVLEHCTSVSCFSGSSGATAFSITGNNTVLKNCAAYTCGTGFSISGVTNTLFGCMAVGNAVNGFTNNSATSLVSGSIAFASGGTNFGGTGPIAYVQVNNGGQLPPGSVVDPQIDNISIV